MFEVDLHAHTRFFHGFESRPTPYDPVGANLLALYARGQGLDGVALTNHDYYTEFDPVVENPVFIPGIEVTTTQGHALIVGPNPPSKTDPGVITPREVVTLAHDEGCAAIIPHPYRRSSVRESGAAFDAVEVNGKHPGNVKQVRELANTLDLPIVGGSDAHFPFEAGRAFTAIDAPELTPEAVVSAIRDGRIEPRIRTSHLNRALQTGYRHVHRFRERAHPQSGGE